MKEYGDIESTPSVVREPMAIYHSYGTDIVSPIAIALKAVKGLSSRALSDLEYLSGLSKRAVARFLHVTSRSLNRYLEEDRVLDAAKSETLLKLIALYQKGTEVFSTKEAFNAWLAAPAMGLSNHIPFDLMETSTGIDLIDEELDRIAYGDVL